MSNPTRNSSANGGGGSGSSSTERQKKLDESAERSQSEFLSNILVRIKSDDPTLTQLYLYKKLRAPHGGDSGGGDGAIAILVDALLDTDNTHLRVLDVGSNGLTHVGATALAALLTTQTRIEALLLRENRIGHHPLDGLVSLCDGLKSKSSGCCLTSLSLGRNGITPEGAIYLASALEVNTTLRSLWLYGNSIGDVGCAAIANALEVNPASALVELYLGSNGITNVGAQALVSAFRRGGDDGTARLAKIELFRNRIGNEGAAMFADLLSSSASSCQLRDLNVRANGISYQGVRTLLLSAAASTTDTALCKLDVRHNDLTKDEEDQLLNEIGGPTVGGNCDVRLKSDEKDDPRHSSSRWIGNASSSSAAAPSPRPKRGQMQKGPSSQQQQQQQSYADRPSKSILQKQHPSSSSNTLLPSSAGAFTQQARAVLATTSEVVSDSKVTLGRTIAQYMATRFAWYAPNGYRGSDGDGEDYDDEKDLGGSEEVRYTDEEVEVEVDGVIKVNSTTKVVRPSLERAWDYFEQNQLPRYLRNPHPANGADGEKDGGNDDATSKSVLQLGLLNRRRRHHRPKLKKAHKGEHPEKTRLYPVWSTTETDLSDFGVGVTLYFFTLRVVALLMLIAAIINIPNIVYFASTKYNADGGQSDLTPALWGSAICTDQVWKACPECPESVSNHPRESTPDRFAISVDNDTGDSLYFILRNNCTVGLQQGMISFGAFWFLLLSYIVLQWATGRYAVKFERAQVATDDYSVEVCNPPRDATDPDEWRDFFSQFCPGEEEGDDGETGGQVTVCTVARGNRALLAKMIERRKALLGLKNQLQPGVDFDPEDLDKMVAKAAPVPNWRSKINHFLGTDAASVRKRVDKLAQQIEEMASSGADDDFPATRVFVTFETEHAQRRALEALSVPRSVVRKSGDDGRGALATSEKQLTPGPCWLYYGCRKKKLASANYLFRGRHVLRAVRPSETSDIRWEDLEVRLCTRTIQRLVTFIIFAALTAGGAFFVRFVHLDGAIRAALVITALNMVIPVITKIITKMESHLTEGSLQTSMYIKISVFRMINTAVITYLVTPFTDTLTYDTKKLIPSVFAIFIFEMVTGPAMQLSDYLGHLKRHFLGPRAPDQWRMDANFTGGYYTLAEKMTNLTKMVFLTGWYSTIFPQGFIFAFVALCINYWVDKFCLLRTWAPAPNMSSSLLETSNIFFLVAMLMYSVMQAYAYSGFPYDNACEGNTTVSVEYEGQHVAIDGMGQSVNVTIAEGEPKFYYCYQDLLRIRDPDVPAWPARPDEWMSDGQAKSVQIMGQSAFFLITSYAALILFSRAHSRLIREDFWGPYKPSGKEANKERFSDLHSISGYVPQIRAVGFPYPLLACDISKINPGLIGWIDDDRDDRDDYVANNLLSDFPTLGSCFSRIKHWPPPEKKSRRPNENGETTGQ